MQKDLLTWSYLDLEKNILLISLFKTLEILIMSYLFYIEMYWAHQIYVLIKTTYEPLRTYIENCKIYAMLPKRVRIR